MTEGQAQWRTIAQAAAELGRSERTIRRWLETGRLEADRTKKPLRVNIADEITTESGQTADLDRFRADIDRLRADNARLESMLSEVMGQRDYLRDALAKSQTLVDQQQQLTQTLTGQRLIEAPGRKRWWEFWKTDEGE